MKILRHVIPTPGLVRVKIVYTYTAVTVSRILSSQSNFISISTSAIVRTSSVSTYSTNTDIVIVTFIYFFKIRITEVR